MNTEREKDGQLKILFHKNKQLVILFKEFINTKIK